MFRPSFSITPSPSPEPSDVHRTTPDSLACVRKFDQAHITTEQFNDLPKLGNLEQYPRWLRELKRRARISGFQDLISGVEKAPAKPDEATSTWIWNQYMLAEARWLGRNSCFLGYIRFTLEPYQQYMLDNCTLVVEALEAIKDACPPVNILFALRQFRRVVDYRFDENEVESFGDFCYEFESRVDDLNDLGGGLRVDGNWKSVYFLIALGPRFERWYRNLNNQFKIAGMGEIRDLEEELSYIQLRQRAEAEWANMNRIDRDQQRHYAVAKSRR